MCPSYGGKEQEYVNEAFETNWISPVGPNLQAFEESISSYHGEGYHTAALSSGTAAIHLALILLGVERGDEVICSSFTFAGTCNPIMYLGATPVFIDSEKETWNMDPDALEEAIKDRLAKGKKVKAIIPVHLYGMPANMPEIMKVAREYEIPVIEDAAEALGASLNGQKTGTFGDLAVFSFNGNKIITTSGGGALMSKDKEQIEKSKFLATQARDQAPHYQHSTIGYNYRLSNISAGIGRGQMEVLDERIKQRRAVNSWYKDMFSGNGFDFLTEPEGYFSNYWLTTALLEDTPFDREELRLELEKENIEARPLWKPMHLQPVFEGAPYYGDKTSEYLFEKGVCLPSCSSLDEKEKERIHQTIVRLL
ncbi:aminotransferase class I/II-fold pyridoxal phosphate-dependent enzyme [Mangrovivirga cuniculi]|uniref:aminotransferase class I/II-fold pyridoxal phosphate-dependent enzyme n=1 Tax=Mangrovivirga cuniculi TaxID=2715131 RepID=UPI001C308426|nr:aminotransferase class I/II-fold pyridoxal phosphate-dependent enzyme [Mangrovivirga cuniculi]